MGSRAGRLAGGIAAVVMVAAASIAADAAIAQEHDGGEGPLPPGDWTDEQVAAARDLVQTNEQALQAFADPSRLEELGFYDFGGRAPGGWDHWIHPAWMADDHYLDPARPESLVFRATEDGDYVLEAAMYILPPGHDMSNIPEDVAWLPGWHTHDDICIDDEGRFAGTTDPDGNCYSGTPMDWPPMLHVWIVDNSCGHRFAGVDVGGIECGGHGHQPPGGGHQPPGGGHQPPGGGGGHQPPGSGGHGQGGGHGTTPTTHEHGRSPRPSGPAVPVHAEPHFQG